MAPRAFSTSIGYTIFAQYGRDRTRLEGLVQNATRYVWLLTVPMFLGLAVIASPLIRTVYGGKYAAVVPVLYLMSVFAVPRAFQVHSESLLQATETQGFMVKWLAVSAVVNLGLDWLLIPTYGALGAAVANGLAQGFAVGGVWIKGSALLGIAPPLRFLRDIAFAGIVMSAAVLPIAVFVPAPIALPLSIIVGAIVFGAAVRVTGCLTGEDLAKLGGVLKRLPAPMQSIADRMLRLVIVPGRRSAMGAATTL